MQELLYLPRVNVLPAPDVLDIIDIVDTADMIDTVDIVDIIYTVDIYTDLMIMSFILPTMRPYPFSSMTAVSPVWNHRSGVITSSVFALMEDMEFRINVTVALNS